MWPVWNQVAGVWQCVIWASCGSVCGYQVAIMCGIRWASCGSVCGYHVWNQVTIMLLSPATAGARLRTVPHDLTQCPHGHLTQFPTVSHGLTHSPPGPTCSKLPTSAKQALMVDNWSLAAVTVARMCCVAMELPGLHMGTSYDELVEGGRGSEAVKRLALLEAEGRVTPDESPLPVPCPDARQLAAWRAGWVHGSPGVSGDVRLLACAIERADERVAMLEGREPEVFCACQSRARSASMHHETEK